MSTDPLFVKQNGQYYFYHTDHLGTPQKLTAVNGTVVWSAMYSSFGDAQVLSASTVENPLRLPGQYEDQETGLHYNWHRHYDPELGRYLNVDPIGLFGGINLFSYASNAPIIITDPLGLYGCCGQDCPSGSYTFTGVEYGGFLLFGGVTARHLLFKCDDSSDSFTLTIQCFNFGGGISGGVQMPTGKVVGCNKGDAEKNATGWAIFADVFPQASKIYMVQILEWE